jgi:hypothetical protein
MADEKYYVVEARLPIQIGEAVSVEEAARKAARIIQREYKVDVSNWFFRVFVYGNSDGKAGPVEEWFSNPSGSKFRQRTQNHEKHENLIADNKEPEK